MYYIGRKRERRKTDDTTPKRRRGSRMTFFSLAAAGAFIAVTKAANPGINIKPILLMFGGIAIGCFIMTMLAGRKTDD